MKLIKIYEGVIMKNKLTVIGVALALSTSVFSCDSTHENEPSGNENINKVSLKQSQNPLFEPSPLQYQTPIFNQIKNLLKVDIKEIENKLKILNAPFTPGRLKAKY
jgi:hypothetical protein